MTGRRVRWAQRLAQQGHGVQGTLQRPVARPRCWSRRRRTCGILLLLWAGEASASMFGEENIPLGILVQQGVGQAIKFNETLGYLRRTTQYARDAAVLTQESIAVARNIGPMVQEAAKFLKESAHNWQELFPEMREIVAQSKEVKDALHAIRHPRDNAVYDPTVYVQAIARLRTMRSKGFEVLAHALDTWGVADPHDAAIKYLHKQYALAQKNMQAMSRSAQAGKLNPAAAAVHTAQASSISAGAQVQAAATLEHISRNLDLMISSQADQAAQDQAAQAQQRVAAGKLQAGSWRLDPGAAKRRGGG